MEGRFSKCPEIVFLDIEKGQLGHLLKKVLIPLPQACIQTYFLSICQRNVVSVPFPCNVNLDLCLCKVICKVQ